MKFIINNRLWNVKFVSAASSNLRRSDGSLTVVLTTEMIIVCICQICYPANFSKKSCAMNYAIAL